MYVLIFFLFCSLGVVINAQEGFFCVPVADLVATPFSGTKGDIQNAYNLLSLSPEQGKQSCLRIHQGLFNEQITIIDYKDDQVQVALKNCFYKPVMGSYNQQVKAWVLRDWIVTDDEIADSALDRSIFPPAYGYEEELNHENSVVTLTFPWFDAITGLTYSAGTRFCLLQERSNEECFCIIVYDAKKRCSVISYVPRSSGLCSASLSDVERRKQFVRLLYAWCNQDGPISYVWGGTSFIEHGAFNVALEKIGNDLLAWMPDSNRPRPLCGFDASGLILRAAQICGINYFCCNSTTMANTLSLVAHQHIQEGDILWIPGHVFIIASLENNEIIEAQGYGRGYGKVHYLPLHKRFQDITTWNDFIECCKNNIPLRSLDSKGRCVAHVPIIKIFRLPC